MKKIVSIAILVLVLTAMFGTVLTTTVLADENYIDHSKEYGDENSPWDEDNGTVPNDMYRDEDRTRNKD
jgi:hypothetical protein